MSDGSDRPEVSPARSRREFFESVERHLGANQELLEATGKASSHQLKVLRSTRGTRHPHFGRRAGASWSPVSSFGRIQ
jgi:hypothetical protein